MRRHDIRFRRESLGQTRIERHKDFGGLMKAHRKRQVQKQLMKNVLTLIAVLFLIALIIYGSIRLKKAEEPQQKPEPLFLIERTIDYPDGILE